MKRQRDIYIFLGPPGSGKGSLSQLCVKRLGWQQFSTGNLCREHIAQSTELGKQIDFAIKSGKLISDSLIVEMAKEWLSRVEENLTVVFDGFPRTLLQAQALQELIKELEVIRLKVVHFTIADEDIIYRLLARSICKNDKCQRVYSLHKHSSLQPDKPMVCNECESPLVRRSDDEEVAIQERLKIYHQHANNLLNFYKEIGLPITMIHVNVPLENVYERLLQTMGQEDL